MFLAAGVGLIVSLFPERIRDFVLGVEQPTMSLEPLQILSFGPRDNLERSQWLNMAWLTSLSQGQNSLTALFGIVRVSALGGDAIDCRAAVRAKVQDIWLDCGYLNWFSSTRRGNLTMIPNFQSQSLNIYLANTTEHIPKNESKDLIAFYMVQNSPSVLMCSDMVHSWAGTVQNNEPARFQFEISVTAQNQPRVLTIFDAEAKWGRFLMSKAPKALVSTGGS